MEQYQTSWSRKNSVRQRAERFSQSKNLTETGGKWKMYFTLISLSAQWGPKAHTLLFVFTVFWAVGRRPTPSSEWFLKGPHLISPFTQWAACSPHLLLSDSSKASTLFHRSLNGLPAAHTFFWVIPQSPHLISPCLWVIPQSPHLISPFSQWNAIGPSPGFSQKNLVHIRIQSKKSCLRRNLFHKFCLRRNFFIKKSWGILSQTQCWKQPYSGPAPL